MVKTFLNVSKYFLNRDYQEEKDSNNKPFTFLATGERSKVCVVIPMDKEGRIRLKERAYSYSKRRTPKWRASLGYLTHETHSSSSTYA